MAVSTRQFAEPPQPIVYSPPPGMPPVRYVDDALIVVDKPAGVVVHPARGHWTGTLSQALEGRAAGGDAERPGNPDIAVGH